MNEINDIEDDKFRRKQLNYLTKKYSNGDISEFEYMDALDTQYDILTSYERLLLDEWNKIQVNKAKKRKEQEAVNKQIADKNRENFGIIFFIILSAIVGILILIIRNKK